jgi:hypothetical protein
MPAQLIRAVSFVVVFSASVLMTGCASELETLRSVSSPDGHGSASVVMDGPGLLSNQVIRMEVLYNGKRHIVFETEQQGDLDDCFAAVGWSPDSAVAGFILRPCYTDLVLIKGYNGKRGISVPEAQVRELLRDAIQKDFDFKPGIYNEVYLPPRTFISDPLIWAEKTHDATGRYGERRKGWAHDGKP